MNQPLNLAPEILAYTRGQERGPGHSVPSAAPEKGPATLNTADRTVQRLHPPSPGELPDRQDKGPAMRHSANDYAWRPQDRMEVVAYREAYMDLGTVPAGATVEVNPNVASNFVIRAEGDLILSVLPAEPVPGRDAETPAAQYLVGVKIWVQRPAGSIIAFPGIMWSQDVTNPNGDADLSDSLLGPAAADGFDNYVLVLIPGFGSFGYLAGRGFA